MMTNLELQAEKTVSYDELMSLGSDARVEVVDGEIREMPPTGVFHGAIYGNFTDVVRPYVEAHDLGMVLGDGIFFLMLKSGEAKHGLRDSFVPDASFTRDSDVPDEWTISQPFPFAPTLAVEIMSPDDKAEDMAKKVRRYFEAGTEQVWVIYPLSRELYQYQADSISIRRYSHDDDLIDCESMFPGLKITLKQLLKEPRVGRRKAAP